MLIGAPVGVTACCGQQSQFSDWGVGKHRADALLLAGDHFGGGFADRQTPSEAEISITEMRPGRADVARVPGVWAAMK